MENTKVFFVYKMRLKLWKNSNYTVFPRNATMKLYFRAK